MHIGRLLNHGVVVRQHHLTHNSVQRNAFPAFLFFLLLLRTFDQALLASTRILASGLMMILASSSPNGSNLQLLLRFST